jgi:hypothetical protein
MLRHALLRTAAVLVAVAVEVACVDDVVINTPKNGNAVSSTFPVDVTWVSEVTGVTFKVDGADATSQFTVNGSHATATLTLAAGKHTIRAEGTKNGQPAYDEVAIQVGGFAVQILRTVNVAQGTMVTVPVTVTRASDTPGEVDIELQGLPAGVVAWPMVAPPGTGTVTLYLAAANTAATAAATATVVSTATVNGAPVTQNGPLTVGVSPAPTTTPKTWTALYDAYFKGKTAADSPGHCAKCHDDPANTLAMNAFKPGTDKSSFYAALVAKGLVNTASAAASPFGDPTASPLVWFSPTGKMPLDQTGTPQNPAALADIDGWLRAGAQNN